MKKNGEKEVVYVKDYYSGHKILIWVLIVVIILIFVLTYINQSRDTSSPKNPDTVIIINPIEDVSVGIGNSVSLHAIVDGKDNKVIKWQSSNEKTATVNSNGVVTGVGYGTVTIIATYTDSDGKSYDTSKKITVADGDSNVTLTDVKFPEGDLYMPINGSYQISMVLVPSNALISDKEFTSSNLSVATVDEKGFINAVGSGHSRIIATVNGKYKRALEVYVSNDYSKSEIVISPSSLSFDSDTRKMKVGSKETLNYSITPSNSNRSKLIWTSSNSNIVSVSSDGVLTALSEGNAIVSVSSINGKRDEIIIEVYKDIIPVQDIVVSSTSVKMEAGTTEVITPTIVPENASNKGLSYTTLDASVVSAIPSDDGKSVVLSALKAGTTTVIISSGNVEKKIVVTVEGNKNNSSADEDNTDFPTTIQVRSNKNNLAKTYNDVLDIPVPGVTTISFNLSIGVGKIKYCINRYGASNCTPNIDIVANDTIEIPSGGIYVLRVKKYDYVGNEIGSKSINYVDGVLNYYINTTSNSTTKEYTVSNAYNTETYAKGSPNKLNDKVTVKSLDSSRTVKMCATTGTSCTLFPIGTSYSVTLNKEGLWKIYVEEYDKNKVKLGKTEVYYAYVKSSGTATTSPKATIKPTVTPTPNNGKTYNNTSTNTSASLGSLKVSVSNIKVNSAVLIGKYISVDVSAPSNIEEVRFCYKTVNKGGTSSCNVDTKMSNPTLHNGMSYFHPENENNTFYATFTATKNKTLWFDIDGLDKIYDNSQLDKDVLFEFAVANKSNGKMVYSDPIKLRVYMTKRVGNDSYWDYKIIK